MRGPGSGAPVSVILAAVRERVAATSLRHTAREVGMSPSGLQRVLDSGGSSWMKTAGKLQRWYVRNGANAESVDPDTARAAIHILLAGMPERDRPRVRRGLLAYLAEMHGHNRLPDWLDKLSAER